MTLVSVVTINLNNKAGLERTLASLRAQLFTDFECIVVDGGSSDGSAEIISNYQDFVTQVVQERDNGIYDAMNKGLKLTTGEFVLFLNSGDSLVDEHVLEKAAPLLSASGRDIVYGIPLLVNGKGEEVDPGIPEHLTLDYFLVATLNHQSTFIRRSLFERVGNYDTSLHYVADFEFWIRTFTREKEQFVFLPLVVARYTLDGVSSRRENMADIINERFSVLEGWFSAPTLHAMRRYLELKEDAFTEMHQLYKSDNAFRSALKVLYKARMAPSAFKNRLKRQDD